MQSSQPRPKKLLDQVRDAIRVKHYSYRTEQTYVQWIRRYILFHNKQHPKDMGVPEIEAFLTHLAVHLCFHLRPVAEILAVESWFATIFTKVVFKKRLNKPSELQEFKSESVVILFGTVLRLIFYKMAMTFAPCKSYWATKM